MRAAVSIGLILVACGSSAGGAANGGGPETPDGGATVCDGGVLYVATRGDDANPGCDPARPKKTIAAALGVVQAKGAAGTEIRTCAETLREHVVLAYPASIVGGFDCASFAPGAGRTTIEAPGEDVETVIAVTASVLPSVRLERLAIVGPARTTPGAVAALRVKDGAAPIVRDVEVRGGSTPEGTSIALAVEDASPTIEDSVVIGGRARCTKECTTVVSSGVTLRGGAARLRRTRIDGGAADVGTNDGGYVGTVALDVVGAVNAVFSNLEIAHGEGRVGTGYAAFGMRVLLGSEIDLVDSRIVPSASSSTCAQAPCVGYALVASGAIVRVRRSRLAATSITSGDACGVLASGTSASVDLASSILRASARGVQAEAGATVTLRASTMLAGEPVVNRSSIVALRGALVGQTGASSPILSLMACPDASATTIEKSAFVTASSTFGAFFTGSGAACAVESSSSTLSDSVAASSAANALTASEALRLTSSCAGEAAPCVAPATLATVFADPLAEDLRLKDGVPCGIAQGGETFADVGDDAFGMPRTSPISMGAHEYDGACAN